MSSDEKKKFFYSIEAVWEKLSKVDVSPFVRKKGKFSYLSWSHAFSALCDAGYSDAAFEFRLEEIGNTETFEVWCTVSLFRYSEVHTLKRTMWLPVYDASGRRPKKNPDAHDINTARMRCLTKCLSLYGLGIYIYKGEDLPSQDSEAQAKKAADELERVKAQLVELAEWAPSEVVEKARSIARGGGGDLKSFKRARDFLEIEAPRHIDAGLDEMRIYFGEEIYERVPQEILESRAIEERGKALDTLRNAQAMIEGGGKK